MFGERSSFAHGFRCGDLMGDMSSEYPRETRCLLRFREEHLS